MTKAMADKSKIQWCDATINPCCGCSPVSPACDNCYAARMAARMCRHPNPKISRLYEGLTDKGGRWTGKINLDPERMEQALRWKKPRRIFVGSMTDLFHKDVPEDFLDSVFASMSLARQHTFLILTKRPERMREYVLGTIERGMTWREGVTGRLPGNIWLGVTAENQTMADERIPILLETPAAKRFVSVEPMLGEVDLTPWMPRSYECALSCGHRRGENNPPEWRCQQCGFTGPDNNETWGYGVNATCPECGEFDPEPVCPECGTYMVQDHPDTQYISWVIAGGESGPGARPTLPDWARALRDQCQAAGVPFLFKQWGDYAPCPAGKCTEVDPACQILNEDFGSSVCHVGKHVAGRLLDGVEHNEFPEVRS